MITSKRIKEVFDYNAGSGELYWKEDLKRNSRRGMLAGCVSIGKHGRMVRLVRVDKKLYLAHRLVWLIEKGHMPKCEIDHINGNSMDNRISNLRDVSSLENARNMKRPITNTSGFNGVSYDKQNKKWRAKIKIKGKTLCLGRYVELDDAIKARKEANKVYCFHKNHGRVVHEEL